MTSNAWKKKDDAKKKHLDQKIPIQGSTEYKVAGAWRAQSGLPSDDDDKQRVEEKG